MPTPRNQSFILAAGNSGPLILSRYDFNVGPMGMYGVGDQLLHAGCYDSEEAGAINKILTTIHRHRGRNIVALDGGANIGVFTIEMAKHMAGWGEVLAVEAQRFLYYALCGNVVLNNCFNVIAVRKVLAETHGQMLVPNLDFQRHASFGSLELLRHDYNEDIGQPVASSFSLVDKVPIDEILPDTAVDFIKLDIEGMELHALRGAADVVECWKPVIFLETMKCDYREIQVWFDAKDYKLARWGMNAVAVHASEPYTPRSFVPE